MGHFYPLSILISTKEQPSESNEQKNMDQSGHYYYRSVQNAFYIRPPKICFF